MSLVFENKCRGFSRCGVSTPALCHRHEHDKPRATHFSLRLLTALDALRDLRQLLLVWTKCYLCRGGV